MKVTRRTTLTYDVTEEEHEKLMSGLAVLSTEKGDEGAALMLRQLGVIEAGAGGEGRLEPVEVLKASAFPAGYTPESFAALSPLDQIKAMHAHQQAKQEAAAASTSKPVVVDEEARRKAAEAMAPWGQAGQLPTQMEDDNK